MGVCGAGVSVGMGAGAVGVSAGVELAAGMQVTSSPARMVMSHSRLEPLSIFFMLLPSASYDCGENFYPAVHSHQQERKD
jgi:hypothetical protein